MFHKIQIKKHDFKCKPNEMGKGVGWMGEGGGGGLTS